MLALRLQTFSVISLFSLPARPIPELSFPAFKVAEYCLPCESREGTGYDIEYRLNACFIT